MVDIDGHAIENIFLKSTSTESKITRTRSDIAVF